MKRRHILLLVLAGLMLVGTVGATSLNDTHTSDEQVNVLILYESHEAKADSAVDEVGGTVTGEVDIIPAEFARVHEDDMEELERKPGVEHVELDHRGRVMAQTKSWGIERINGTEAEASVNDSDESKVDVAVIDSGIDYDHEDLSKNVVWGVNTQGTTTTDGVTAADDDLGHGTHVAGIIAAENNSVGVLGVAPKSDLYSIKITDSRGNGFYSDFIEGLDRAVKGPNGTVGDGDDADVISMSYGSPVDSRVVERAVEEASKESVLVAAAINSGDGDASTNEVGYPGVYEETITVAATNRSDETARFSSEGEEVDVAAPGVNITSTFPGDIYGNLSGTSMATPHVSGTVAHIIAKDIEDGSRDLTNEQIRNRLQRTAVDIESSGVDAFSGDGRIQANRSLIPQISAEFSFSPTNLDAGELVTFDASNSNNPNGSISSYDWNFGDGNTTMTTTDTVSHTYSENGTFVVTLTVNGDGGSTDTLEREITVGDPNPGSDWTKFRNDTRNTGHHPRAEGPKRNVVEKWKFSTGGPVESSPAVVDGAVYVGSDDNNVYALNESNGNKIWSASTGGDIRSSPWAANRAITVGSNDDETHTFDDETGGEFTEGLGSSLRTNDDVFSSPTLDTTRAIVYFGSQDGTVYAFGAAGVPPGRVWTFSTGGPVNSSAALANGNVYIGSGDGNVYALDSLTGNKQWNTTTGGPVISSPAVVNGSVYVGSADGNVYSMSASTGSISWNTSTGGPVVSSPAVANGVVYIGSNDNNVYALDASNGNMLWSFPTGGSVRSSPAVVDNTVYVGSNDNKVYALNASTASMSDEERERWNYTTGGDVVSSPAVVKNTVYVGSSDGNVYALTSVEGIGTPISSCTDITSSGEYALTDDIINSTESPCIEISSSDVIFDGNGHIVDGEGSGFGVHVNGPVTNVTVKNAKTTDWDRGISLVNASKAVVLNNTARNNADGIHLNSSDKNRVEENNISSNENAGLRLRLSSDGNRLVNNTFTSNGEAGIAIDTFTREGGPAIENLNNTVVGNNVSGTGTDGGNDGTGILLGGVINNTIKNNTITDAQQTGITVFDNSSDNTIRNNTVKSTNLLSGIALLESYNNTVQSNTAVSNEGAGIFLRNSSNIKIEENIANSNNATGIGLNSSKNNTVQNNTANSNGISGIGLVNSSSENTIRNNTVKFNDLAGIGAGEQPFTRHNRNVIENNTANSNDWIGIGWVGSNNTIENNTAHNNSVYGIGLGALPSNNNELIRNDIQFNDAGIILNASSEDNVGFNNIIENNTEAIVTEEGAEILNQSSDGGTSTTTTTTTTTTVSSLGTGVGTLSQEEKKNAIRNNSAKNSDVAFRTSNGAATAIANLDIGESSKPNTLVSLEGENVSVRAVANPPDNPNATSIGRYLNATEETNDSFLNMGIRYKESDVEGINESSLSIWKHNGTEWREINSSVNTTQNVVNASVTEFSTFGVFAETTATDPASFDVNITGTNSPVVEGEKLTVDVNVTNTGGTSDTQEVNLTDFDGVEQDSVNVTLGSGESNSSITLDWTTTEGDNGTGDVTVFSENDSDTQSVTVNETAFFDVNVTGTNSPVTEGDTLTVDVNVTNTGDETATQTLNLTDTDFNNNEQDTVSVTLAGGESNSSITLDWNTAEGDNGTGDVTVFSENSSDAETVTVNEPAFFDVNITGTNSPVTEGDTLSVDVNVTNTGDETATQTLNLTDTGFNNNEQDTVDVALNGGESNSSITLNWTTAEGDNGTGDVAVFSENDSDTTNVTVNESNTPPTADFTFTPDSPSTVDTVEFNASSSDDSDGSITNYTWNFGDGETGMGETVTHSYDNSGTFTVTLNVTDDDGATADDTQSVTVMMERGTTEGSCVPRRDIGRGEKNKECPRDRELGRGESRDELDRETGRNSDTARRDRGRNNRGRGR